jgi:hypothetical protein
MDTATLQIWHPQIRDSTIALKKKILLCCYPRGVAPVLYIRKLLLDMTNVNFMQEEAHSRSSIIDTKRVSRHNTCTLVAPEHKPGRETSSRRKCTIATTTASKASHYSNPDHAIRLGRRPTAHHYHY